MDAEAIRAKTLKAYGRGSDAVVELVLELVGQFDVNTDLKFPKITDLKFPSLAVASGL